MRKGKSERARGFETGFDPISGMKCRPFSVWLAVLSLVYLEQSIRVDAFPVCSYGQAGCPLPLADLFDRVIQQSSRMHGVSSDLHSKFVRFYSSSAL